jgi:Mrp family chromosome partitioning ATPase
MGEHSPIPVPEEGRSLIERVSSGLAFAAPPPREPRVESEGPQSLAPHAFGGAQHPIDRDRLREQGCIVPGDPVTALFEELRLIKRPLLLAAAESRAGRGAPHGERILVASAMPGEGKTFAAVNLALAIAAEKDNEVLLVDADFAKPSVLSTLGLPGGPGLMDAIADPSVRVEDCVVCTDVPGLSVLPAGQSTYADTEFLASARTGQVLDRLSVNASNRLIIFDSSPALAASPAAELAAHVGQALVVVRADRTGEAALADALTLLSACPDRKLLLNGAAFSPTGRKFGAYYGYGG